jgi:hypothetical protein
LGGHKGLQFLGQASLPPSGKLMRVLAPSARSATVTPTAIASSAPISRDPSRMTVPAPKVSLAEAKDVMP